MNQLNTICKVVGCDRIKDRSQGSSMCVMHRVRWSRYKSHDLPEKILPPGIIRICKRHGNLKLEDTYLSTLTKYHCCRKCRNEARTRIYDKNPEDTQKYKKYYYVGNERIKVLITDYNRMHEEQGGVCAICKRPETCIHANKKAIKRLAIDHCHKTMKIRGLLCQMCNQSIGAMEDSTQRLQQAIDYLNKHSE